MVRDFSSHKAMSESAGNSLLQSPNKSMVRKSQGAKFPQLCIVMWVTLNGFIWEASAAGECGRIPIRVAFASLSPCMVAARDPRAKVPPLCCDRVNTLIRTNPRCLNTVFHSPAAKFAGIVPAAAMSIPKRCNIRNRPARRNA
ncbi:uncharacterized protein LOC104455613 [Eucalyptus grandis]|uniref:uncharacterized protein LOC104455613 n=1 Tax=Eucalyptus grandis TaxID=71139 RepID=UPI00192E8770|nr:uncharacterized protein LOC104455613 [Eucalyptus grandis]